MRFLLSVLLLLSMAAVSQAQCSNGTCALRSRGAAVRVARVATAPVRLLRRQPVRRFVRRQPVRRFLGRGVFRGRILRGCR